jgi:hypothetical protein
MIERLNLAHNAVAVANHDRIDLLRTQRSGSERGETNRGGD